MIRVGVHGALGDAILSQSYPNSLLYCKVHPP